MIEDEKKLAEQVRAWSKLPDLQRVIPSHGEIVDRPQRVLERIAEGLG